MRHLGRMYMYAMALWKKFLGGCMRKLLRMYEKAEEDVCERIPGGMYEEAGNDA